MEFGEKAVVEIEEKAKVLTKELDGEKEKAETGIELIAHGTQVRHLNAEPPSPIWFMWQMS